MGFYIGKEEKLNTEQEKIKLCYNSLYNCIFSDIHDVLNYLNDAFKTGIVYAIIFVIISYYIFLKKSKNKKQHKNSRVSLNFLWHFVGSTLFVMYFYVLCNIVYFSREPGSRNSVDMRLLSTWGVTSQAHAYVIENIILFIPFGFLFPACLPEKGSVLTIFIGSLCSMCIEYIQFRTGCGYCQIDDIVTNILGTIIGYCFFVICRKICGK